MKRDLAVWRARLERLYRSYGLRDVGSDPVLFPRRYRRSGDREVAGFVASALAYGGVEQIRLSVERVLEAMGPSPRRFVSRFDPAKDTRRFEGFSHRWTRAADLASLFFLLRQALERWDSIGDFFLRGWRKGETVGPALIRFVESVEALDPGDFYGGGFPDYGEGVRFFFPSPSKGSACKRLCMYLRWMVRRDGIDLGLWRDIPPSALVMPIDTHVTRIAFRLGWIPSPYATWRNAEELTENLRRFDPDDPVKYDFALSRIGILERWPRREPRREAARKLVALCRKG